MQCITVKTEHRNQLVNIDHEVTQAVRAMGIENGVITVFCPHTTAGITINENADPDVCSDFIENLKRIVPSNQSYYTHREGNSDAHMKSSLIGASEQVIVQGGKLQLGTWQSLYFAEFDGPRTRKVWISA